MRGLIGLSRAIDQVTAWIGKLVAWLVLVAVVVSAANAIVRKAFNISSNAWLELQWYLFGAVFMLVAAWTLQRNEHVRIDVLSSRMSRRTRVWIDLVCHLVFLLPFVVMMIWLSWPFFLRSYVSGEQSMNAGGLITWPAKFLVLLGFVVLLVQTFSEIIKSLGMLTGHLPLPEERDDAPPVVREEGALGGTGLDTEGGRNA